MGPPAPQLNLGMFESLQAQVELFHVLYLTWVVSPVSLVLSTINIPTTQKSTSNTSLLAPAAPWHSLGCLPYIPLDSLAAFPLNVPLHPTGHFTCVQLDVSSVSCWVSPLNPSGCLPCTQSLLYHLHPSEYIICILLDTSLTSHWMYHLHPAGCNIYIPLDTSTASCWVPLVHPKVKVPKATGALSPKTCSFPTFTPESFLETINSPPLCHLLNLSFSFQPPSPYPSLFLPSLLPVDVSMYN